MDFLDAIETQLICNRLPLAGVSVAAIPCGDTPVVLSLHWLAFVEHKVESDSGPAMRYEPVPSSCLQLNGRWREMPELEDAVMEVAWELGAWDLSRQELGPCMRPGAPSQEMIECEMAFGQPHRCVDPVFAPVSDVEDAEEILSIAGQRGYLLWRFRPIRGGIWEEVADDVTLERGGYRNPRCPQHGLDFGDTSRLQKPRQLVYCFGRSAAQA